MLFMQDRVIIRYSYSCLGDIFSKTLLQTDKIEISLYLLNLLLSLSFGIADTRSLFEVIRQIYLKNKIAAQKKAYQIDIKNYKVK